MDAALLERNLPEFVHQSNGDEDLYPSRIGNYSKGLPHNSIGEPDPSSYRMFLNALATETHAAIEKVPMGCSDPTRLIKLTNPGCGFAYDLQGADSHHLAQPPAPKFASAETAGEMVELYWMALARDVSFANYGSDPIIQAAVAELNQLSDFRGPKVNGAVTPQTLFRGVTPGDFAGPYLSQFLVMPLPYGAEMFPQTIRSMSPGVDFATGFDDWLMLQNGWSPTVTEQYDGASRIPRNGRDMAQWAHHDVLFGAYLNAALILATPVATSSSIIGGLNAPLNPGNPYVNSVNQTGFGTFGTPHITAAVGEVATRALRAVWYEKWFVHRRLRPEEMGGRIHLLLSNRTTYPIHNDVLHSQAAARTFSQNGTWLLPQAYTEGCPTHPSYGAGHATVAGACVTILKAFFDESWVIPKPVVPAADGLSLQSYTGPDTLTVGGELNKLAFNIAGARAFAGIHWRSDTSQSLLLGEQVAIDLLTDQRRIYGSEFAGFTFTKFDGSKITV
jgi:membrane-associated phospholipid phosphatase